MPPIDSPRAYCGSETAARELKALAVVLGEEFDTSFRFYDRASGKRADGEDHVIDAIDSAMVNRTLAREPSADRQPDVVGLPDGRYLLEFPLDGIGPPEIIAAGAISALARTSTEFEQERARLTKWVRSYHDRLRCSRELSDQRKARSGQDRQSLIAWDALMGLERLHGNLQIHKDGTRNKIRVLRTARELLGASTVVWVSGAEDGDVVIEGERLLSPWDVAQLANLIADHSTVDESGYVIVNEPEKMRWGMRFPQVSNLLAISVTERSHSGWLIAFNKREITARGANGQDRHSSPDERKQNASAPILPFRRLDIAVLMPFASLLHFYAQASRRYLYIKDVMVGLTRSLTAAIDAKDEYTYGHSERVARVAVELGIELGLRDSEQNDIYLAGLLHDIGKIGIRDAVLTKRGPLNDEEFKHIQQHPVIGHRILSGLHAIDHLLPGVLYHHERYDGGGYPEGLRQDSIPLVARILAVADSFDAMNTSRSYRAAMPAERVDQILREGAGIQWDPAVIDAYFRCRERLLAIRQHGLGESFRNALDGALRNGMGQGDMASLEISIIN